MREDDMMGSLRGDEKEGRGVVIELDLYLVKASSS